MDSIQQFLWINVAIYTAPTRNKIIISRNMLALLSGMNIRCDVFQNFPSSFRSQHHT